MYLVTMDTEVSDVTTPYLLVVNKSLISIAFSTLTLLVLKEVYTRLFQGSWLTQMNLSKVVVCAIIHFHYKCSTKVTSDSYTLVNFNHFSYLCYTCIAKKSLAHNGHYRHTDNRLVCATG